MVKIHNVISSQSESFFFFFFDRLRFLRRWRPDDPLVLPVFGEDDASSQLVVSISSNQSSQRWMQREESWLFVADWDTLLTLSV